MDWCLRFILMVSISCRLRGCNHTSNCLNVLRLVHVVAFACLELLYVKLHETCTTSDTDLKAFCTAVVHVAVHFPVAGVFVLISMHMPSHVLIWPDSKREGSCTCGWGSGSWDQHGWAWAWKGIETKTMDSNWFEMNDVSIGNELMMFLVWGSPSNCAVQSFQGGVQVENHVILHTHPWMFISEPCLPSLAPILINVCGHIFAFAYSSHLSSL